MHVIQKLCDTVLQQIEAVKSSPEHVSQAKQVFQGEHVDKLG